MTFCVTRKLTQSATPSSRPPFGMEQFLQRLLDRNTRKRGSSDSPPISLIELIDAFREFVEELPVMVYAVEPEPPYAPIYVSPAFSLLRYPLDEWNTDPHMWTRVIHPDDRDRVFFETTSSTLTGKDVDYEYRIIAADGAVHWVHDRGCLIRDEAGQITHRQGVIIDVTDQKLADQQRQRIEADLGERHEDETRGFWFIRHETVLMGTVHDFARARAQTF